MSLDINALQQMMTDDTAAITKLKELLMRERTQLEKRKQDELPKIIDQKTQLLDYLNHNTQMRNQLLRAANLPCNAKGWDTFLQRDTRTLALRSAWQNVLSVFEECKKMNEINGKMIARSQQTLSHLINLVRGKVATPSLYTAQGIKTQQGPSYTVAKA
jgi:flagellar biosynthesis protein FlgN